MNRTRLPALTLALAVLLLVGHANSSQPNEDDAVLPPNADNIEIHHIKMINGVMHEDHPIVMYKEDFVSEDYDPKKNYTATNEQHKKHRHMRHHRIAADEPRIQFDTLPDTPIIIDDVAPTKEELLQKHPKKYRSRQRRQALAWRPASYYSTPYQSVYYQAPAPLAYLPPPQTNYPFQRFAVHGKPPKKSSKLPYWQEKAPVTEGPVDIGSRLNVDESNPLHHNSNPADADFSVFDQPRPNPNEIAESSRVPSFQSPPTTWSPPQTPEEPRPVWGPSPSRQSNSVKGNPSNSRPQQQQPQRPTQSADRRSPVTTSPRVSNCVWAIVNCCSRGSPKIRYACFEDFNCHGAFWGVNPCADETIRDVGAAGLFGVEGKQVEELPEPPPLVFTGAASAPVPRPIFREDSLQYPEESGHQAGSSCQRAAAFCCRFRSQLATLYDCFARQKCEQSLSNIIADCS